MRTVRSARAIAIAVGVAVLSCGPSVADAQVISACYHKKKGKLRILTAGECRKTEQALQWNLQGEKGEQGDPGPAGAGVYRFSGIMQDLPILSLTGWRQCYTDLYADVGTTFATIRAACPGPNLLLGCRPTGAGTLRLAANAPRADVFFDTGTSDALHVANGVGWYFNDNFSWGFAPPAATVARDECDIVTSEDADKRLCWHTFAGAIGSGYRCGDNDLNGSAAYERVIFEAP